MKTRMILSLGLSALVFGGTMVGCTAGGATGLASASDRDAAASAKAAAKGASNAAKALSGGNAVAAVRYAEAAVALAPTRADYRMLLGQGYLKAGRFASARQAFQDTLALSPENGPDKGKAALNLALATIASGDWQLARTTLADNAGIIPDADRGLAMALAGDPAGAVALLTQAARSPQSSPKVRQNLALSLALAGQWQAARVVAQADLSPADVDRRLEQWAAFAQPQAASDQVASLLGVRPAADAGQPVALALNTSRPTLPGASVQVAAVSAPVAVASVVAPEPEPVAPVAMTSPEPLPARAVRFAAPMPVVQSLPTPLLRAPSGAVKTALFARPAATTMPAAATARGSGGDWYVQVGAFDNAAVARDAFARVTRKSRLFAGHAPNGATVQAKGTSLYRLSFGGFDRAAADSACRRHRAEGGVCFVRKGAGDRLAQWVKPGVQLASR